MSRINAHHRTHVLFSSWQHTTLGSKTLLLVSGEEIPKKEQETADNTAVGTAAPTSVKTVETASVTKKNENLSRSATTTTTTTSTTTTTTSTTATTTTTSRTASTVNVSNYNGSSAVQPFSTSNSQNAVIPSQRCAGIFPQNSCCVFQPAFDRNTLFLVVFRLFTTFYIFFRQKK